MNNRIYSVLFYSILFFYSSILLFFYSSILLFFFSILFYSILFDSIRFDISILRKNVFFLFSLFREAFLVISNQKVCLAILSRTCATQLLNHTCEREAERGMQCVFFAFISFHTICQKPSDLLNKQQGGIIRTTPNSESLYIRAESTSTTLPRVSLRSSERNTAGRVVQPRTSAQIT